jgi:hypothetical protein
LLIRHDPASPQCEGVLPSPRYAIQLLDPDLTLNGLAEALDRKEHERRKELAEKAGDWTLRGDIAPAPPEVHAEARWQALGPWLVEASRAGSELSFDEVEAVVAELFPPPPDKTSAKVPARKRASSTRRATRDEDSHA